MIRAKIILSLFFLSILVFSSCSLKKTEEVVVERTSFQATPLDDLYTNLRPAPETFTISTEETQNVTCKNGTEILIPANVFIDGYGNPVSGDVEIEVIEVNQLTDFITCDLPTLADDRLLESAGMVYIDAKSDGKSLRIADGQKISITMPMMQAGDGFQIFSSNYNDDGSLNWTIEPSAEKDYLIPIPADLLFADSGLYLGDGYDGWFIIPYFWNPDSPKYNIADKQYANTLLHTREFKSRMWSIFEGTSIISSLLNNDDTPHSEYSYNTQLYDLYYDSLHLDIQILDSMANSIIVAYMQQPEFIDWVNSPGKEEEYKNWIKTLYEKEPEDYPTYLMLGSDNAKGNVPNFKDYGIDPLVHNAFDLLVANGAAVGEAQDIINFAKEQAAVIDALRQAEEDRGQQAESWRFARETAFSTTELGWINCDRFYDDPNAGEAEIIVSISSDAELKYTDCSLIIPSRNARLSAFPNDNAGYAFTQENGVYTKLPIGEEAIIVGISKTKDQCYWGFEKVKIQEKLAVTLEMSTVQQEALGPLLRELLATD